MFFKDFKRIPKIVAIRARIEIFCENFNHFQDLTGFFYNLTDCCCRASFERRQKANRENKEVFKAHSTPVKMPLIEKTEFFYIGETTFSV